MIESLRAAARDAREPRRLFTSSAPAASRLTSGRSLVGVWLVWAGLFVGCSPAGQEAGLPSGGGASEVGGRSAGGVPSGGLSQAGGAQGGGASPTTGGSASGGYRPTGGSASTGGAVGGVASGGVASGGALAGSGGAAGGAASGGVASGGVASGGDSGGPEPFVFGQAPRAAAHFKKGINLGNRLEAPSEGDWGASVLSSDFSFLAGRGFDHVRIPIRFSGHALESVPYAIDGPFFQRIDTVLDQATAAGLGVIIDLHAYEEMSSDPNAHLDRFLALWSQIALRYQDRPETVAFELFNEPNTMLDDVWNEIVGSAIATVRASNPRRLLVIDTVFWADPSRLSQLALPDDANLLVSIHLYEPKLFSFQGKSWMGDAYMTTGVVFPGPPAESIAPVQAALETSWAASWFEDYNTMSAAENPSGPATIDAQMAYITTYQNSSGRTVYNGEWGPQDSGDMASRANLVKLVRERCEAEGVGWAIWEDRNNMQLFDSTAQTWVEPIIDALLPR